VTKSERRGLELIFDHAVVTADPSCRICGIEWSPDAHRALKDAEAWIGRQLKKKRRR